MDKIEKNLYSRRIYSAKTSYQMHRIEERSTLTPIFILDFWLGYTSRNQKYTWKTSWRLIVRRYLKKRYVCTFRNINKFFKFQDLIYFGEKTFLQIPCYLYHTCIFDILYINYAFQHDRYTAFVKMMNRYYTRWVFSQHKEWRYKIF